MSLRAFGATLRLLNLGGGQAKPYLFPRLLFCTSSLQHSALCNQGSCSTSPGNVFVLQIFRVSLGRGRLWEDSRSGFQGARLGPFTWAEASNSR